MACPECGRVATEGDAFCAQCGHDLRSPRPCVGCGKENEVDAHFCTGCGSRLDLVEETPVAGSPDDPTDVDTVDALELDDEFAIEEAALEPWYPVLPSPPLEPRLVPPSGMRGWASPHPEAVVTSRLAAGTEVVVTERRGAWAMVMTENGWTGWVDDRRLIDPDFREASAAATVPAPAAGVPAAEAQQEATTEVPTPAPAVLAGLGAKSVRPLSLAGGAAVAVAAFLSWLTPAGLSVDGFDVPINYLLNYRTTADHFLTMGLLALIVGAAGVTLALVPGTETRSRWLRIVGLLMVVVGALFLIQLVRFAADFGFGFGDLLGAGPVVAIVGGALMATGR